MRRSTLCVCVCVLGYERVDSMCVCVCAVGRPCVDWVGVLVVERVVIIYSSA